MDDKRPTPDAWLPLFERGSVTSAQQIAEKSGVAVQTVLRLIHGEGRPSPGTLEKVGRVLRCDTDDLLAARGDAARAPFKLPVDANRLTTRQRAAILAVVRAMLEPESATGDSPPRENVVELPTATARRPAARKRPGRGTVGPST